MWAGRRRNTLRERGERKGGGRRKGRRKKTIGKEWGGEGKEKLNN